MNRTAGRVTPYAPPSHLSRLGAHGVTRPAAAAFTTQDERRHFKEFSALKSLGCFSCSSEVPRRRGLDNRCERKTIVADVDGDGLIEVVAVGNDGVLRAIGEAAAK